MRFLIVAERELRAASRRKATYYVRWLTGVGFFVLLIWLMWAMDAFTRRSGAHDVFAVFSVIAFFYCLFIGAIRTADCISSERRKGTLGLLFLTNLNSAEIVTGKLFSNAVPTVYGLLSFFPMLALPLLMGGVTAGEFLRCLLALGVGILFSLGCGFLSTVVCRRQFPAVAMALGLVLALGTLSFAAAGIVDEYRGPNWLVQTLASLSPLYAIVAAFETRIMGSNQFWLTIANVTAISLLFLGLATLLLACTWRDRAKSGRQFRVASTGASTRLTKRRARRAAFTRRLLNINPFYWLASRRHVSSPVFIAITAVLVLITVFGTTPLFSTISAPARYQHALGAMIAWLCLAGALHLLALYYAAMVGSQSVAEDRHTGAMELIFSTPVSVRTILKGLGAAFRRRMFFPAIAVSLSHCYFVWLMMRMAILEPPGFSRNVIMTPWEMLWVTLLNLPVNGRLLEWEFVMIVRTIVLVLPLAFVLWITLAKVGRWLGLRMKHPGFAPMVALALLIIPPVLVYSLGCYIADEAHVYRYSERILIPIFVGAAFGLALLHCAIIGGWASRNLRENFRQTVIGQPDKLRRTWRARGISAFKFALKTAGVVAVLCLLVVTYYAYQNHRSRRQWKAFQAEIQQKHISLGVAALLPQPAPEEQNFARSKELQSVLLGSETPLAQHVSKMPWVNWAIQSWRKQEHAVLANFADYLRLAKDSSRGAQPQSYPYDSNAPKSPPASFNGPMSNAELAPLVLKQLEPLRPELERLAVDAGRPLFQPATNLTAVTILQSATPEPDATRKLHLLYALRALALLQTGEPDAAARDVVTGFRLARLAGQLPSPRAAGEAQLMLVTSLQPLWEGLERHAWNESQLASLQTELAALDPVADFTNSLGLVVQANIEIWRLMPDIPSSHWQLPSSGNYYRGSNWRGVHRDWWLDCCVKLYRVNQDIVTNIAGKNGSISGDLEWSSINDLPLDNECQQVFQRMMNYWWGDADARTVTVGQTIRNQALIAIALERRRVEAGQYPSTLDELVPALLPTVPVDVKTGRKMQYETLTNGAYLLRGLGRDQRRGAISDDKLWAYPTNAPAATGAR